MLHPNFNSVCDWKGSHLRGATGDVTDEMFTVDTDVAAGVDGISTDRAGGADDHVLPPGFRPLHTYWDDQRGMCTLEWYDCKHTQTHHHENVCLCPFSHCADKKNH